MSERLPAYLEVDAIRRNAETDGDFAAILQKGDPTRGSILIVLEERGKFQCFIERSLGEKGRYVWTKVGPGPKAETAEIGEFVAKRRRFDSDLWLIELDVADHERFVAQMTE